MLKLKDYCNKCNVKTITVKPPRFSPEDKYGKYRRILKKSIKNNGQIKLKVNKNE